MILIIGGAYQGKMDHAKAAYHLTDEDVFTCTATGTGIDYAKRCIYQLEEYALACIRAGLEPVDDFRTHREEWLDSILICRDIFCGVVPMDPEVREWRQATGRLCQYLSREAEQVSRIFCGLEQRLK